MLVAITGLPLQNTSPLPQRQAAQLVSLIIEKAPPGSGAKSADLNRACQYHSRLHTAHGHRKSSAAQGSERG